MKKLLTLAIVLFAIVSFAQNPKFVYPVADTAEHFSKQIDAGNFIYDKSTKLEYVLNIDVSPYVNLGYVLKSPSRYDILTSTVTNITNITNTAIDTALVAFTNTANTFTATQTFKDVYPDSTAKRSLGSNGKRWQYLYGTNLNVGYVASNLMPTPTNTLTLGGISNLWATIYANTCSAETYVGTTGSISEILCDDVKWNSSDTTVTAVKGKIIYKYSDNHFYGCINTGAGKKWKQLDN